MKILLTIVSMFALLPAGYAEVTDLLPPDGVPTGWEKQGSSVSIGSANLNTFVDQPSSFTNNGYVGGVEQTYTDGTQTISVRIFKFASSVGAGTALSAEAGDAEITSDIGEASVLDEFSLMFANNGHLVQIVTGNATGDTSADMAALAMTIDAYLLNLE